MEFSENFTRAFNDLKNNLSLVVPFLLGAVIMGIVFLVILFNSGILNVLSPVMDEFVYMSAQEEVPENFLQNMAQAASEMDWSLMNWSVVALWIAILVLSYLFLISTFYLMIRNQLSGRPVSLGGAMKEAPNYMLKFLGYRLIWVLITTVPFILAFWLVYAIYRSGAIMILVPLIPLLILAGIAYSIFVSTRLIFSLPELFMAGKGPLEAFGQSYDHTRGHFKQVLLLLVIIIGIGMARSVLTQNPLSDIVGYGLAGTADIFFAAIIGLFVLLLSAAILAFGELYLFHSYKDFLRETK